MKDLHIIKSRHNTPAFWGSVFIIASSLFLFIVSADYVIFNSGITSKLFDLNMVLPIKTSIGTPVAFFFVAIFFTIGLFSTAESMTINIVHKTIVFKKFLSKREITYSLNDIDGFAEEYYILGNKGRKIFYLIKNEKVVKKVFTNYYSNTNELIEGLKTITDDLGYRYLGDKTDEE